MQVLLYVLSALSCVFAFENSDEYIAEINSKQNLWTAGRNFHEDTPFSKIESLLGAKTLPKDVFESIPIVTHEIDERSEIPETFDARTQWANCKSINRIADQSSCGSCWAISVAAAISDRICIHSNGTQQPEISGKSLLACTPMSMGCLGGYPYYAWLQWNATGVVTGGGYDSKIGCEPYPFPECDHYDSNSTRPVCQKRRYATPACRKKCANATLVYANELHYGASGYGLDSDERQIQEEILKNGPVVTDFIVYSDFVHYKSGVYFKTSTTYYGKHAVRVIGWGVENSTKYWLVVNSWNDEWGDKGLFKIRRGTNECQFESRVTGGIPRL